MGCTSLGPSRAQLICCSDKWSVVELGLQKAPLHVRPTKTPSKNGSLHAGERQEQFPSTKTTSSDSGKQTSRSQRRARREHCHDNSERKGQVKSDMPTSIRSPVESQETDSYLVDFSTLSYADMTRVLHGDTTTPVRTSRLELDSRQQTRGRFGQIVRNFVKKMLPQSPSGRSTSYGRTRQTGNSKGGGDSPSWRAEITPRSESSGDSRWTFASAGGWMEGSAQACLDCQATKRWSGFWHS